jgi:metallo-beta-lactamase family protein
MEYKSKLNRANKQKRHLVPKPIYTVREVEKSMEHFLTLPFSKSFELNNQASITLYEAGHLLGAASVAIDVKKNGATKRITFTGDLGRSNAELIRVPQIISETSILVSETTYGGRVHKTTDSAEKELMRYIDETCVRLRGRLIIPAFSVGRTQSIVHVLKRLYEKGTLPPVKIFVDSPLAIRTTAVYEKHAELLNQESLSFLNEYKSLFAFDQLYWIEDMAEHDETLSYTDSCVIISAAGMVEGGRIQEHVKNNIRNPFSTILIAGFCAEGTLGHRLLNGQKNISMGGRDYPVYAKIASTDVFSSHPDQHELMKYLDATINEKTEHIFLVHGDEPNLTHMQHMLKGKYSGFQVHVPDYADEYNLN